MVVKKLKWRSVGVPKKKNNIRRERKDKVPKDKKDDIRRSLRIAVLRWKIKVYKLMLADPEVDCQYILRSLRWEAERL